MIMKIQNKTKKPDLIKLLASIQKVKLIKIIMAHMAPCVCVCVWVIIIHFENGSNDKS